jgi:hypothetical protein
MKIFAALEKQRRLKKIPQPLASARSRKSREGEPVVPPDRPKSWPPGELIVMFSRNQRNGGVMVTSYLRYVIDPYKLSEFEKYGKMWIPYLLAPMRASKGERRGT